MPRTRTHRDFCLPENCGGTKLRKGNKIKRDLVQIRHHAPQFCKIRHRKNSCELALFPSALLVFVLFACQESSVTHGPRAATMDEGRVASLCGRVIVPNKGMATGWYGLMNNFGILTIQKGTFYYPNNSNGRYKFIWIFHKNHFISLFLSCAQH